MLEWSWMTGARKATRPDVDIVPSVEASATVQGKTLVDAPTGVDAPVCERNKSDKQGASKLWARLP